MNIAILNYTTSSVDLWDNIPNELTDTAELENYLAEELGYRLDEICYMLADEITCYHNDSEEPFEILRHYED